MNPTPFTAVLETSPGKGGWTFAPVPTEHAPEIVGPWGRTPVIATVDDVTWATSVWRDKQKQTLLAVPKRIRKSKGHGDTVVVTVVLDETR